MAKPAIPKRATKAAALTYAELDTNFQNIVDATVSVTAGTGGTAVTTDLNGNITLVAGTGISLSGNNTSKEITINSTASSNTFNTIAVSGQSDVVAEIINDTLTLVAGANITLTTNATTDSITIAAATPSTNATTVTITDNSTTNTNYALIFGDTSGNLRRDTGLIYNPSSQTINVGGLENFNIVNGSAAISLSPNGASQFSAAGGALNLSGTLVRIQNGALSVSSYSNSASVASPENGMIIYNSTTNKFQGRADGAWVDLH